MGYSSAHVERAVICTRVLGRWSLILGVAIVIWAFMAFPWKEPLPSPADHYTYVPDAPVESSEVPHATGSNVLVSPAGEAEVWVDIHESRTRMSETVGSLYSCILPGLLLLLLARYMGRLEYWTFLTVILISLGFIAAYLLDLVGLLGVQIPIHQEPIVTETLLRPIGFYLLAVCLNALPDVQDAYHGRRRERHSAFREPEPISPPPQPVRLPPRPTPRSPRE